MDVENENECSSLKQLQAKLEKKMREFLKLFFTIKGVKKIRLPTCEKKLEFDMEEGELNVKPDHVVDDKSQLLTKSIDTLNHTIKILSLDSENNTKKTLKRKKEILVEKEKLILAALKNKSFLTLCKKNKNDDDEDDDDKFGNLGTVDDARAKLKKFRAKLPEHLLKITELDEQLKVLKEYTNKVSKMCNEFKSLCSVRSDLKKGKRELNYLENKTKTILKNYECIKKKFNSVKNNRSQCFLAFFNQLAVNINQFYQVISVTFIF